MAKNYFLLLFFSILSTSIASAHFSFTVEPTATVIKEIPHNAITDLEFTFHAVIDSVIDVSWELEIDDTYPLPSEWTLSFNGIEHTEADKNFSVSPIMSYDMTISIDPHYHIQDTVLFRVFLSDPYDIETPAMVTIGLICYQGEDPLALSPSSSTPTIQPTITSSTVSIQYTDAVNIKVLNILGQKCLKQDEYLYNTKVDLTPLKSGTYLLILQTIDGKVFRQKIYKR